jgi:hypothetical protein
MGNAPSFSQQFTCIKANRLDRKWELENKVFSKKRINYFLPSRYISPNFYKKEFPPPRCYKNKNSQDYISYLELREKLNKGWKEELNGTKQRVSFVRKIQFQLAMSEPHRIDLSAWMVGVCFVMDGKFTIKNSSFTNDLDIIE